MARKRTPDPATTMMIIRMPVEVKAWLASRSKRTLSTMNYEVVRALQERIARESEKAA